MRRAQIPAGDRAIAVACIRASELLREGMVTTAQIDEAVRRMLRMKFEAGLLSFMENTRGSMLEKLRERKKIDDEIESELRAAVTEFKERFTAEVRATTA